MKTSIGAIAICVASLIVGRPATTRADDYPSHAIHIQVGFAAGGVADSVARLFARELSTRFGENVIVDNMPSVYNLKPTESVLHAAPDGYTLMQTASDMLMLPFRKKNYRYDFNRDFTPIATLASSSTVFAVNDSVPVKTLKEFIEYARAKNGTVRYGSGGIGTPMHLAGELLQKDSHVSLVHVPYPSGASSLTDLLGGRIEMGSIGLASAKSVEGQNIRVLAQTGSERHPLFPDVPTVAEAGYPEAQIEVWFGLMGPPKLSPEATKKLDDALKAICADPAFQKQLVRIGMAPFFRDSAAYRAYIDAETKRWSKLIPAMGLPELD